jgi:hypothetical protein
VTPAERAYRLALLAYPASYRRERGLEILTTILDGGDSRWPPRGRELVAIVLDGVARRGQLASGGSRAGSLRAGVRLAAFLWFLPAAVASVCWTLYPLIGADGSGGGVAWWRACVIALLGLGPVIALTRSWWYGPLAVAVAGIALSALGIPGSATWPWQATGFATQASVLFVLALVPGIACILARPRAGEPADARSSLWVPAAVLAGALMAWQGLFFTSWLGRPLAFALIAGFLLARRDPRLAAAAAGVALLALGDRAAHPGGAGPIWLGPGAFLTPLLVAFACAALWRLRPRPVL